MGNAGGSEPFRSECKYDLRDPDDRFTGEHFDRVQRQIQNWSFHEAVSCETSRTPTGFHVTVRHSREISGGYGMSLYVYLMTGIFIGFNLEGISLKYLEDVPFAPDDSFGSLN